jgi:hypothetical protein
VSRGPAAQDRFSPAAWLSGWPALGVARERGELRSTAAQKKGWSTAEEPTAGSSSARRFFVEFRARNAASYGHLYVMYGEVNDRHEVIRSEIAGFFPAGDSRDCENCSAFNWTIGHVLPVPSEIGASDGDLEEQYVLARFRVWIDAAPMERATQVDERYGPPCSDAGSGVGYPADRLLPYDLMGWTTRSATFRQFFFRFRINNSTSVSMEVPRYPERLCQCL